MLRRREHLIQPALAGIVASYLLVVALQIGQQWPPDFAAFYAVARALAHGQAGGYADLYTVAFQTRAFEVLSSVHGEVFAELFLNPPPAVWLVTPWTVLPLRIAFLTWDAFAFALGAVGTAWLARQIPIRRDPGLVTLMALASYPFYLALGEGQYDLLWPLALALFGSALGPQPTWHVWAKTGISSLIFVAKPELFLVLVVPAVFARRVPAVRAFAVWVAALAIFSLVLIGPRGLVAAIHLEAYNISQRYTPLADSTALSVFWHLLGPGRLTVALGWAALALAIVGMALAWARKPPIGSADWMLSLSSVVCLSLVVAPHSLGHSLTLLVGPLVWCAAALQQSGRGLGPLIPWVATINIALLVDSAPGIALPVPLTPLVLMAAAVIAWRARRWLGSSTVDGKPYGERAGLGAAS